MFRIKGKDENQIIEFKNLEAKHVDTLTLDVATASFDSLTTNNLEVTNYLKSYSLSSNSAVFDTISTRIANIEYFSISGISQDNILAKTISASSANVMTIAADIGYFNNLYATEGNINGNIHLLTSDIAYIIDINATSGSIVSLTSNDINSTYLNSTYSTTHSLTADYIQLNNDLRAETVSSMYQTTDYSWINTLNSTAGTIKNLSSDSVFVSTLSSTTGTIKNLSSDSAFVSTLSSTTGTVKNLSSDSAFVSTLSSTTGTVKNLSSDSAFVSTLSSTTGTIKNLSSDSAFVSTLSSTTGTIKNLSSDSVFVSTLSSTTGTIKNLSSDSAFVSTLSSTTGTIKNLSSDSVFVSTLSSTTGTIKNLSSDSAYVSTLSSTTGTIKNLSSDSAYVSTLSSTTGIVKNLSSDSAFVNNIEATTGVIKTLSVDIINTSEKVSVGVNSNLEDIKLEIFGSAKISQSLLLDSIYGTSGNISILTSLTSNVNDLFTMNIDSTSGKIKTLSSEILYVENLSSTSGIVNSLTSDSAFISVLNATSGNILHLSVTSGIVNSLTSESIHVENLQATSGNILHLSVTSGIVSSLTSDSAFISVLNATSANLSTLISDFAHIDNLSSTSGFFKNLTSETFSIENLSATVGNISTLGVDIGYIDNLSVTSITLQSLIVEDAGITNLTSENIESISVNSSEGQIGLLYSDDATIVVLNSNDLFSSNGYFEQLNATSGQFQTLNTNSLSVTSGQIQTLGVNNLNSTSASITNFVSQSANIEQLNATSGQIQTLNTNSLSVTSGVFKNLLTESLKLEAIHATSGQIQTLGVNSLNATSGNLINLGVDFGYINNLSVTSIMLQSLNVDSAAITTGTISNLTSTTANIDSITNTNLETEEAQIGSLTSTNVVGENGTFENLASKWSTSLTSFVNYLSTTAMDVRFLDVATGSFELINSSEGQFTKLFSDSILALGATVYDLTNSTLNSQQGNIVNLTTTQSHNENLDSNLISATSIYSSTISSTTMNALNANITNLDVTSGSFRYVGIGTSEPINILDVSGDGHITNLRLGNYWNNGVDSTPMSIYTSLFPATKLASINFIDSNLEGENKGTSMTFNTHSWAGAMNNEVMRVTARGKVGINTTNPAYLFDVNGNSRINGTLYSNTLNSSTINSTQAYITTLNSTTSYSDNAGVGTSSFTSRMFVKTDVDAFNGKPSSYDNKYFVVGNASNNGLYLSFNEENNNGYIGSLKPGVEWCNLILQPDEYYGRVGIGTSNPQYRLDVNGNSRFIGDLKITNAIYSDTAYISTLSATSCNFNEVFSASNFYSNSTTTSNYGRYDGAFVAGMEIENTTLGDRIYFQTHLAGAHLGRRITIDEVGYLGIGNTNPQFILDVNGDSRIDGKLNTLTLSSTSGQIKTLASDSAFISNLSVTSISLQGLNVSQLNLNHLSATSGQIKTFASDSAFISNLSVTSLSLQGLDISQLNANSANVVQLSATNATITSNLLIGNGITSPQYKLEVNGTMKTDQIIVGTEASTENTLKFKGTNGDSPDNYTVISERLYSGADKSEMLLFKGNDSFSFTRDRIRYRAPFHAFQTYETPETYDFFQDNNTRMVIDSSGFVGIGLTEPKANLNVLGDTILENSLLVSGTTNLRLLQATSGQIKTLASDSAFLSTLSVTSGTIKTLASDFGFVSTLSSTSGQIKTLASDSAFLSTISVTSGQIKTLSSDSGFVSTLSSTSGQIKTLSSDSGFVSTLNATGINCQTLTGSVVTITSLTSTNSTINQLNVKDGLTLMSNGQSGFIYKQTNGQVSFIESADGVWSPTGANIFNSNTGNVGINTQSPIAKLQVNNGTGSSYFNFSPTNASTIVYGTQSSSTTDSSSVLVVGSNGNGNGAGITFAGKVSDEYGGFARIRGVSGGGKRGNLVFEVSDSTGLMNEKMRMSESGTITAYRDIEAFEMLTLYSNTVTPFIIRKNTLWDNSTPYNTISSNDGVVVVSGLRIPKTSTGVRFAGNSTATEFGEINTDTNGFYTKWNDVERFRISSAGNVGIGVANPLSRLHIDGNIDVGDSSTKLIGQLSSGTNLIAGMKLIKGFTGSSALDNYITFGVHKSGVALYDAMTVTPDANVGIGTSLPNSRLHVTDSNILLSSFRKTTNSGDAYIEAGLNNSNSAAYIGYEGGQAMFGQRNVSRILGYDGHTRLYSNNTERMIINSSGNVGIGVQDPAFRLDLTGAVRIRGSGNGYTNVLQFFNSDLSNPYTIGFTNIDGGYGVLQYRVPASTQVYGHMFVSGISDLMYIRGDGRIGIGTTVPQTRLDVNVVSTNDGINCSRYYLFGIGDNTDTAGTTDNLGGPWYGLGLSRDTGIVGIPQLAGFNGVCLKSAGGLLVLNSSGNLGVGTTIPTYRLQVSGTAFTNNLRIGRDWDDGVTQTPMSIFTESTNGGARLASINFLDSNVPGVSMGTSLSFNTHQYGVNTNVERMRISGNGNIGISTTAPQTKLTINHVSSSSVLTGLTSYGGIHMNIPGSTTNNFYSGITFGGIDNGIEYPRNTTQAGILCQSSSTYGTKLHFLTTNSYGAGQQNRMTIDQNGAISIGRTDAFYMLDVNGDIRANGWLRTEGQAGLYFQSYGGGWNQTDDVYVTCYGYKRVKVQNLIQAYAYESSYDNRNLSPANAYGSSVSFGFGSYNNNWSWPWADTMLLNTYYSSGGGNTNMIAYNKNGFGIRQYQGVYGSSTVFSSYNDALMVNSSGLASTHSRIAFGPGTRVLSNTTVEINSHGDGASSTNWVAASIGSNSGNHRIVMGTLGGVGVIGGHNATHTAWTDLLLNPGGANVGINRTGPSYALDVGGDIYGNNLRITERSNNYMITTIPSNLQLRGYNGVIFASTVNEINNAHSLYNGSFYIRGTSFNNQSLPVSAFSNRTMVSLTEENFGQKTFGIVKATSLVVSSDERIKTNIQEIQDNEALILLRQIEPKKYDYLDHPTSQKVYGFIAQQVNSILPDAIYTSTEFLPNILSQASLTYEEEIQYLTFDQTFNLVSNSRLKLYIGTLEYRCTILEKITDVKFKVEMADVFDIKQVITETKVCLVYGSEVDNFMNLKKDYLYAIHFSATQELDRNLTSAKQEIETLKTKSQEDETKIQNLTSELGTAKTQIQSLTSELDTAKTNITGLQDTITNLNITIQAMLQRIQALEQK